MDELKSIQVFLRVVESGSFSAAGRDLNKSTSSISRQVEWLEQELGVHLLNRNTRNHSLTEAGKLYYERIKDITNDISTLKGEMRSVQDDVQGFLRVALRRSSATSVIIPALPSLLEQYPDLEIEIIVSDERPDLIANNIDIAMWVGDLPDSDLIVRRLSPSRRVLCASPDYISRRGMPCCPEDLKTHSCLIYNARSYGRSWTFSKEGRTVTVPVRGNLNSEDGPVLVRAAMKSLGMIVMPYYMVREQLKSGVLQQILPEYQVGPVLTPAPLYAVFPPSRRRSRRARIFVDFLVALFGSIDD